MVSLHTEHIHDLIVRSQLCIPYNCVGSATLTRINEAGSQVAARWGGVSNHIFEPGKINPDYSTLELAHDSSDQGPYRLGGDNPSTAAPPILLSIPQTIIGGLQSVAVPLIVC